MRAPSVFLMHIQYTLLLFVSHAHVVCATAYIQTGEDVKNDQFDAAYDLSSADEGT